VLINFNIIMLSSSLAQVSRVIIASNTPPKILFACQAFPSASVPSIPKKIRLTEQLIMLFCSKFTSNMDKNISINKYNNYHNSAG